MNGRKAKALRREVAAAHQRGEVKDTRYLRLPNGQIVVTGAGGLYRAMKRLATRRMWT